ncbi:TMEM175 family protein [Microbacterium sp. BWT-B31]|uniref:TMEM175 family protein n=1 Tax=Microbacterium sp. BWT-B31 TaxID=3232072 RepID=UPI0035298D37
MTSADAETAGAAHRPASPSFMSRHSFEFGREVSFFDAVYGFAATLLISNVDAPPADAWRSLATLEASGLPTQVLGFALSFAVIAVFWRVNVRLVRRLTGMDGVTTFVNLVTTALVILIAFTTQGVSDPDSWDLALPTALYAMNIALVAILQLAVMQVARARGLERTPMTRAENAVYIAGSLVSPVVFLISVPIAFAVDAYAARWTWAALIVLGPLTGIVAGRLARRRA